MTHDGPIERLESEDWEHGGLLSQDRGYRGFTDGSNGQTVVKQFTKHAPSDIGRLKQRLNRLKRALRHLRQARWRAGAFDYSRVMTSEEDEASFDAEAHWGMCIVHYYAALEQGKNDALFNSVGRSLLSHLHRTMLHFVEEDFTLERRYTFDAKLPRPRDDEPIDLQGLTLQQIWQDGINNVEWLIPGIDTLDYVDSCLQSDMATINDLIEQERLRSNSTRSSDTR